VAESSDCGEEAEAETLDRAVAFGVAGSGKGRGWCLVATISV
jgi:hypothetical protein